MFNLQGSEIVIILLLALVVLGPEKLPDAMRKAGKFYAELKKMSTGFQTEFRAAVEEPLREFKETTNTIRDSADFTKLTTGQRSEKPKSAEMVAAPDPDAVPTDDLPFQPDAANPASTPDADPVAPTDQEPFLSVVVSGGTAKAVVAPSDRTPDALSEFENLPSVKSAAPAAFSGAQISSSAVPAGKLTISAGAPDSSGEQSGKASRQTPIETPDDSPTEDPAGVASELGDDGPKKGSA